MTTRAHDDRWWGTAFIIWLFPWACFVDGVMTYSALAAWPSHRAVVIGLITLPPVTLASVAFRLCVRATGALRELRRATIPITPEAARSPVVQRYAKRARRDLGLRSVFRLVAESMSWSLVGVMACIVHAHRAALTAWACTLCTLSVVLCVYAYKQYIQIVLNEGRAEVTVDRIEALAKIGAMGNG